MCSGSSQVVDMVPCVKKMSNGCSIPLKIPIPYAYTLFKPACDRHDICYQCVSISFLFNVLIPLISFLFNVLTID